MLSAGFSDRLIRIRTEEYDLERKLITEYLRATLLEREAKTQGISVAALLQSGRNLVSEPTAQEIDAAWTAQRGQLGDLSETLGKAVVRERLVKSHAAMGDTQFFAFLEAKYNSRILLEPPRIDYSRLDNGPAHGPQSAPVTILEYSDFQCPFCAKAPAGLLSLQRKYPDKIRVIFKYFPLKMHKDAQKAAEAAVCAEQQGKFWEFHDLLFANQQDLSGPALTAYAGSADLDRTQFESCISSGVASRRIGEDKDSGTFLDIDGTPTFFVNGRYVEGLGSLEAVVREELEITVLPAGSRHLGMTSTDQADKQKR